MRLVILGGNAAGLSAASRARRMDRHLEITVLEKGRFISYGSCGLPYYVEGRVDSLDELLVYSPDYLKRERNIEVRTEAEAAEIAHARREVLLAGGERVPYDRLVVATGAGEQQAGIPGADLPHVFPLGDFEDARRLREFLRARRPKRAVVIGAGYVGLEAADALRANGVKVTVLEAAGGVLGRTGGAVAKILPDHLGRCGIVFRPNQPVRSIEPDSVNGVPAELVILAAGRRAENRLATEAGIATGATGAIRVNEYLETNLHGIYAAGDCAEVIHLITGRPARILLGTIANKMGRVAGANAAGRRERFPATAGTSIVRVCGLGVGLTGLSAEQARREGFDAVSTSIEALEKARYFWGTKTTVELVAERRNGRLLGGAVLGEEGVAGRINVIATALRSGMRVDEFEYLDLAYSPPFATVWDPLLIAAQQLKKLID